MKERKIIDSFKRELGKVKASKDIIIPNDSGVN